MKALLNSIVVAVNGSKNSIDAAMYGILLAKQYGLSLTAVFVVDTETIKFLINSRFLVEEEKLSYTEALERDGKNYLAYIEKLALSKGVQIATELRRGSVFAEVIAAADSLKADMILVGGRSNTETSLERLGIRRSVSASSRNDIALLAHCPVLVVHEPDMETRFKNA